MIKVIPLILRMIREHKLRAGLTILGVAVATFIFAFFEGVQGSMGRVVADASQYNNLVVMEAGVWCTSTSELPDRLTEKFAPLPQVEGAMAVKIVSSQC